MSERAEESLDIRRAALRLLARREHSVVELLRKLSRRFPEQITVIKEELESLNQEGLQSDGRLAEAYVRSRAGQGRGSEKIRAELRNKGVGEKEIRTAFLKCKVDWLGNLEKVSRRRFGSTFPENIAERAKRSRFFRQRGFSYEEITTLF